MTEHGQREPAYNLGYAGGAIAYMEARSAERCAGFVLPHLKPGMRLLDCGCGPGTITVGLAAVVDGGEVVGVDSEQSQVEAAAARARRAGLVNARFERRDVLAGLDYDDESFDVVFAHGLFEQITDPAHALDEFRRVLRPGGFAALRSCSGLVVQDVDDPLIERSFELLSDATARNGGYTYRGRIFGALMRYAGFDPVLRTVSHEQPASWDEWPSFHGNWAGIFSGELLQQRIMGYGLAEQDDLDAIVEAWRRLGETRRGCAALEMGEAIGWR